MNSPVFIGMKELPDTFSGILEIENHYEFTNLSWCSFKLELVNFRKPWEDQPGHITGFEKIMNGPQLSPGMKGEMKLEIPADWKQYDGMLLTGYSSTDRFCATDRHN
jgi:hypothetical protein